MAAEDPRAPSHWPENVRPITLGAMGMMGVDPATKRLYWDGKEIVVRERLSLGLFERVLAVVVALAAIAGAVAQWVPLL